MKLWCVCFAEQARADGVHPQEEGGKDENQNVDGPGRGASSKGEGGEEA